MTKKCYKMAILNLETDLKIVKGSYKLFYFFSRRARIDSLREFVTFVTQSTLSDTVVFD